MYRSLTRKSPSIFDMAERRSDRGLGAVLAAALVTAAAFSATRSPSPEPNAARSWPIKLISNIPRLTSARHSATMSSTVRLRNPPRIIGIAQKEQRLSQPSVILTNAERGKERSSGRSPPQTPFCAGTKVGLAVDWARGFASLGNNSSRSSGRRDRSPFPKNASASSRPSARSVA